MHCIKYAFLFIEVELGERETRNLSIGSPALRVKIGHRVHCVRCGVGGHHIQKKKKIVVEFEKAMQRNGDRFAGAHQMCLPFNRFRVQKKSNQRPGDPEIAECSHEAETRSAHSHENASTTYNIGTRI